MTGFVTDHVHQLGLPCRTCGYVAVPCRFYSRDGRSELPYEKALEAFKDQLRESNPEGLARVESVRFRVTETVTGPDGVTDVVTEKICDGCGGGFEGHGKKCGRCRTKAYRERRK